MKVIWRGCSAIFFLITFILSSVPTAIQGLRLSMCLNQSQIEGAIKRFKTSGGVSYEVKLKQILDCLNPELNECSASLRAQVTEAILLRGQLREMGQDCTSDGKYSKPFGGDNSLEDILSTGLTFCNPFKHLYCSPQKKCECRPGTALNISISTDVCTLIVGGYCLEKHSLFDPFNSDKIDESNAMEIPALECTEGLNGICKSTDYFHRSICPNDEIVELDKKLVDHFKDLPRLNFGDLCNLEHHEELLKSPEAEWSDYKIRVKKLEEIMAAKTQFCDLQRLLFCGNSSRKCECLNSTFYDENKKICTTKRPIDLCLSQTAILKDFEKFTTNASLDLDAGYKNTVLRECKGRCIFVSRGAKPGLLLCTICNRRNEIVNIGRNCDKTITSLLSRQPPIALAADEPDYGKQLDLLDELSDKATELEKILRLDEGSSCNLEAELDGARAIRRIKNLEVEDMVASKEYYRETIRFTDTVIRNHGARRLCKYPERTVNKGTPTRDGVVNLKLHPDLVCGPMTSKNPTCYSVNSDEYLEVLKKRLISFDTLQKGQTCTFSPERLLVVTEESIGRRESFYQSVIQTLETHFVNNTQFCDTKAGLECAFPLNFKPGVLASLRGKCDFLDEVKKKMENSGYLRANNAISIHVSFIVILFTLY